MVEFINFTINKKDIIYDGKVKTNYGGLGVIRLKEGEIGDQLYVIFPIIRRDKGGEITVGTDEILNKKIHSDKTNTYNVLEFQRKYVGRKCIIVKEESLKNILLTSKDIIFDGEVKKTYNGQGLIILKDKFLGHRAYVIFHKSRLDFGDTVILSIDEIFNIGIHSNNNRSSRVLLPKSHVGNECLIILQEG